MSALAHDERDALERRARLIVVQIIADVQNSLRLVGKKIEVTYRDTGWSQAISSFAEDHALAASRQREEAAKGEIARLKAENTAWFHTKENLLRVRDALIAENDRLTLAASESARTLQVEITALKAQVDEMFTAEVVDQCVANETSKLRNQVAALREAIERINVICHPSGSTVIDPPSEAGVTQFWTAIRALKALAALPQP